MVIWGDDLLLFYLPAVGLFFFQHFPIALAGAHEVSREASEVIGEELKVVERLAPMMATNSWDLNIT